VFKIRKAFKGLVGASKMTYFEVAYTL